MWTGNNCRISSISISTIKTRKRFELGSGSERKNIEYIGGENLIRNLRCKKCGKRGKCYHKEILFENKKNGKFNTRYIDEYTFVCECGEKITRQIDTLNNSDSQVTYCNFCGVKYSKHEKKPSYL